MDLTAQVQPHVRFTEVRRLKGDRMLCTNVFSAGMFAQRGAYVIHDPNTAAVATATASTQLIWTFNATPPFAQPHLSPHVALQPLIIHNERSIFTRRVDQKRYELTDHLGNVRAVVSDKLIADYDLTTDAAPTNLRAKLISRSDYYPFGSLLPGRNYSSDAYRFGFNGKEKDDEVYGASGTSYDYGFRIYDPRVARFLSTDPLFKSYPFYTPYQFAGNNPVAFIDLDGLERAVPKKHDGRTALEIYTEKHGKVDIYNPTSRYGEKRKRGDPTGWGFGQEFPSLVGEPTNRTYEAGQSSQENPLTRQSWQGEDRTLEGRVQLIPEHNDGRLTLSFEPGTDEKGKPVNGTFELGVIDAEGKEHSLASTTSNKPGSISIDFRLKEGESLYQRSTDLGAGGSLRTSATIAPDDKNEK